MLPVGGKAHPVGDARAVEQLGDGAVGVETVEAAQTRPVNRPAVVLGHRPSEDPPRGVGYDVVEAEPLLSGQRVDHVLQGAVPQDRHGAPLHQQQQRPVCLESEAADHAIPLVEEPVLTRVWAVAEEPAGEDVGPVEQAPRRVPKRALPHVAAVIGDEFQPHRSPPSCASQIRGFRRCGARRQPGPPRAGRRVGGKREKGFEPSTLCLGSRCSTPELLPRP